MDNSKAESHSHLALRILGPGNALVLDTVIPGKDTPQDDLERGQANWYFLPGVNLDREGWEKATLTLSILGDDAWLCKRFFLFGLDTGEPWNNSPKSVVPLVYMPRWGAGWMSTDPGEGIETVNLPLFLRPPRT